MLDIAQTYVDKGIKDPAQLIGMMTDAVNTFTENAEQSDDLTMLAIKFAPVSFERALDERLTLQNDIHQVPKLNAFVKETLERIGVGPSLIKQLKLAVEEAVFPQAGRPRGRHLFKGARKDTP